MAAVDCEITLESLRKLPYAISRVLQETVLNASFLSAKKTSKRHYYPAYDLKQIGRLGRLQIQLLLEGIRFIRKLENL
jgi:hypothetical protein